MKTVRVPQLGLSWEVAESLQELSPSQWLRWVELTGFAETGKLSVAELQLAWLMELMNLKTNGKMHPQAQQNLGYLVQQIKGFWEETPQGLRLHTATVYNLLPRLKVNDRHFKGPALLCHDISFGQFLEAYQVFAYYLKDQDAEALPHLTKALYQVPNDYLKGLEQLPGHYHKAVLHFFDACVHHIQSAPLVISGQSIPVYKVFSGGGSGSDELPMAPVLFNVSENGVFGTAKEVKQANLFEVLQFLYNKHLQAQDLKKRNARNRTSK